MSTEEKMELIKLLTEMHGLVVINKLEGKNNNEMLEKCKKAAERLQSEGIGVFDFSSDEKFEESLSDFLKVK